MALVSFKSLIDYALELNGMSINRLATTIGVDRPWLQHALVGRRNLGYDNFEKIMNSLTLSEQLNTELRETFAKEYFGEANFDIIKNCLKRLNTMSDFENIITPPPKFSDNSPNSLYQQLSELFYHNENSKLLFENIYSIIAKELKKKQPMFYTTYALTTDSIRNLFVNILRFSGKTIDYRHIVFNEPAHTEQDIIDMFLCQYELAGYGYNSYYARHSEGFTSSSPLPYFILTSEAAIFFSKD